jgi:hypothetical protein
VKKIISFFIFFSILFINSQIKLEIRSLKSEAVLNQNYIEVKIINTSNFNYAIPIDTSDIKPDFFGNSCDYKYENDNIFAEKNDMLFRISFINNSNSKFEDEIYNFPTPQDVAHSEIIKYEYYRKKDSVEKIFNNKIESWVKANNFKKIDSNSKINYLLCSNLLLLKPKQEFIYNIKINSAKLYSSRMHETETYYYYYNLKNDVDYSFMLIYCVDKMIYKYLTKKQKEKLKGYKLFSGNLNSNLLKW